MTATLKPRRRHRTDQLRVTLVPVCAYAWLILVPRSSGKRALAKLDAFDFVVTGAFGSTLSTVLLSKEVAFAEGALAFVVLAMLQFDARRLSLASNALKRFIRSEPTCSSMMGAHWTRRF